MKDKAESTYRDEAAELEKGSDHVQGRSSGEMDGDGTESSSPKFTPAKGEQRWQRSHAPHRSTVDSSEEPEANTDASDRPAPGATCERAT